MVRDRGHRFRVADVHRAVENCWITACTDSTDFDTQIALWKAENCGDFATYTLGGGQR